jgi:large subunit ribosomal protein L9
MDVILLEDIQNLGSLGDLVSVKSGYARNYLVPYGKAVWATEDARDKIDQRRAELAKLEDERLDVARAKAQSLPTELTIPRKASDDGKLYGSVSSTDIADILHEKGIAVNRSEVSLPQGPIKEIGEIGLDILFHPDVRAQLLVKVIEES